MFGETKHWNDKEGTRLQSAVSLGQVYLDKSTSTTKPEATVLYPEHAMLLNSSVEFRRNFTYNGHTVLGFLPGEYEDGNSTGYRKHERECSGNGTISPTYEFVPFENFIVQSIFSNIRGKNIKLVHR